ncbi:hypothetical protein BC477_18825 [Clavibacter michiganensis subsp. michiganensis]|uniref:MIP18 family-like domain-containing protein n=1 Tax=Clavibacter michiganensis subsp. michiganensis TaxID=33013 RepID=A0A251XG63_CLAMM|nr:hypothetical protein BC477_18825 [Clavibacter michiganensis subsp. michiganensis]OUE01538.1 hypothetical protein CMMCAS07_14610 [Clavibacter michiganensis subsp. michiganensis]
MPAEAGGSGALTADAVRRALARVVDPEIRRPITELDMVSDVRVEADGVAHVDIALTIVGCRPRPPSSAKCARPSRPCPGSRGSSSRSA